MQVYYRDDNRRILKSGKFDGVDYAIISLGRHPVAYVRIPRGRMAYYKYNNYNDIDINVHGGLTYMSDSVQGIEKTGKWIGWDYAHSGDLCYTEFLCRMGGKEWTVDEIYQDVKSVITQLKQLEA